jgi:hypothetical protein
MIRQGILVVTLAAVASGLSAQEQVEWPAGWKVRLDREGVPDSAVHFVSMEPGWHINTRRQRAIFYNPAITASGEYRVHAELHLFDPGRRHREAYGLFFGGKDLQGERQGYSYFLIRNTGHYLVKRRNGADTETVVPWTASDAIVRYKGEGTATNVLAVECGTDTVDFYINGEKVTTMPRSSLDTDGIVGIRVNHALEVHVEELEVERRGGGT